ncbi:methyltransferase [Roseobacter sp. HKCCD9010]|uniref:class I SAM-dependent methyltransferase n=1 Tax=unclassified Roseobacter TaxID=196798 RepID=UPI00149175F0|nr:MULTISPECIES: class I SAM-dependent methyltransferase [unclassified Roseobacter]MBF9050048.1 methyltransferase [Rhodobacterales bacterium HKCCD4356]NNV12291.1 methyltransferase [Roseobacter sp. HKCCD7357]NNV16246.1 methyltransferase [Roseobacter sp. HKCCD8768]NNV25706.1 methyltransferase [Roseobacter sp. HKCCD8192]NNV29962.1 methyltransferase [Roseobacter sp. HKCCD9061]
MTDVTEQYEAYPYPARDPAEEKTRLITGSPSHPLEIDHFLFAGQRDWSQPFRVLVAGGGTGDALIQLAQVLTSAWKPYEITYLDLSKSSRKIAESRAKTRGLTGISFHTGSLLDAAQYGPFDYIDCCGVLHHLPEPQLGFDALGAALADGGGIGLMVYAPYGRAGVYPLQEAFGTLLTGSPRDRLRRAKAILARLPEGHPFKRNPHLGDHQDSDAGFYDLLLHSQDRPYTIRQLVETLAKAGLEMVGSPQAHLYDPAPLLGDPGLLVGLDDLTRMELAEKLRGTIKTHVVYAAHNAAGRVARPSPHAIPHLKGVTGPKLADVIMKKGVLPVTLGGEKIELPVSAAAGQMLRHVTGRADLAAIARAAELDPVAFASIWNPVSADLTRFGLMYYSTLLKP